MLEPEQNIDEIERALKAEQQRLRQIGKEADALDRDIHPPHSPIDHSDEGGVI